MSDLLSSSDWLSLASILVDVVGVIVAAFVGVWIVRIVQTKLDNERMFKDHMASEVLSLRQSYRKFIDDACVGDLKPRAFKEEIANVNQLATDIISILNENFGIDKKVLMPYQMDLNYLISENKNYALSYRLDDSVSFDHAFVSELKEFSSTHDKVFNLIVKSIYTYNA